MRALSADQRGMTLMEVLFAVAIIGIGLAALSAAIPIGAYGIREGTQLSTAVFLANQRLEQLRNARWEEGPPCVDKLGVSASTTVAPAGTCAGATATTFPDEANLAAPYAGYGRTVRITSCDVGGVCNGIADATMRQVTVTVTYRPMTGIGATAAGTTKAATVSMYISRR